MSYGYIGDTSTSIKQQVKNAGVLSVNDVLDLESQGFLGGSLELIESQTISSATASINFTNIKGAKYDVHFLTIVGYETNGGGSEFIRIRFSNDSGSSYESSNYQVAQQVCASGGTFTEVRSTSDTAIELSYTNNTEQGNNYVYLYNLNNSSKYSSATFQGLKEGADISFGGGIYTVAETINALQVVTGTACDKAVIKLYGVKQI
tara:strand:+ start:56 stop:670 length:615 start_codon:yes stop_codon:yes gene_type:complete